jgi:CheY-like chemotaxis protein
LSARFDAVELQVTDNGVGIPADLLPEVFALFTQGKRSLDRAQGGLGIGLTIVKQLVELHGGQISARSNGPGLGAAFKVSFPRLHSGAQPAARPADSPGTVERPPSRRILIVDDNVDAATTLALLLDQVGHEAVTAQDGPEALVLADRFKPDVVLLDIGLPGMDGFEVARRLRASPNARELRLIALTGYSGSAIREQADDAGFDAFMTKPIRFKDILSMVARPAAGSLH